MLTFGAKMKTKYIKHIALALTIGMTTSVAMANTKVLPEREVPTPVGVSPEFATYLDNQQFKDMPIPTTTEEWLAAAKQFNTMAGAAGRAIAEQLEINVEQEKIAGVSTYILTPKTVVPHYKDKVLIHVHGGAFAFGGEDAVLLEANWLANGLGAKVISIDYSKPPLHPAPAATNDIITVWKEVIKTQKPEETAIMGSSAGGNLSLTSVLSMREQGLPVPGAIFAGTPAVDMAQASDSWYTLEGLDPLGTRDSVIPTFELYAGGKDLTDPLLSPIYADIDADFPPVAIFTGTRDLLLSDGVRMHRKLRNAGVESELHVWEGMTHGDYLAMQLPESAEAAKELSIFLDKHIN